MRPFSPPEGEKDWKRYAIIAGVLAVVAIVVVFLAFSNPFDSGEQRSGFQRENFGFSQFQLSREEITTDENVLLSLEIVNPENRTYEDVKIQLATESEELEITPTNPIVRDNFSDISNGNGEVLTVTTPLGLGIGEKTRCYTFYIGGSLQGGTVRATKEINVRAIGDGEILDNRTINLTIKSEE